MALSSSAALWFLPFVLPICFYVAFTDMREMLGQSTNIATFYFYTREAMAENHSWSRIATDLLAKEGEVTYRGYTNFSLYFDCEPNEVADLLHVAGVAYDDVAFGQRRGGGGSEHAPVARPQPYEVEFAFSHWFLYPSPQSSPWGRRLG